MYADDAIGFGGGPSHKEMLAFFIFFIICLFLIFNEINKHEIYKCPNKYYIMNVHSQQIDDYYVLYVSYLKYKNETTNDWSYNVTKRYSFISKTEMNEIKSDIEKQIKKNKE